MKKPQFDPRLAKHVKDLTPEQSLVLAKIFRQWAKQLDAKVKSQKPPDDPWKCNRWN